MVKVKLAVVRKDGQILNNGVYGSAKDAANKARRCQDLAKQKGITCKITCKFEEFDIQSINTGTLDAGWWDNRYEILTREEYYSKRKYPVIAVNNCPTVSGLNDLNFTEDKAQEYFAELVNQKIAGKKIFHITLTDGTKLTNLAK